MFSRSAAASPTTMRSAPSYNLAWIGDPAQGLQAPLWDGHRFPESIEVHCVVSMPVLIFIAPPSHEANPDG